MKRRIAEVPKTARQKGSTSSRSALPLRRIEEGGISDDDVDTQGCLPKANDWENIYRSPDTFLQGIPSAVEPSDAITSGTDDGILAIQSIDSAMVALKLRDFAVRGDSLEKNIFMDSRSPPPKPPKPVKPPRHIDLTAVGSSSGHQPPDNIRNLIGNDASLIVTQPQPSHPPPIVPKTIETEMDMESQTVPRPMSLRPKSVKFSMSFLDQMEESFYFKPFIPQSTKLENFDRHIVAEVDPLDLDPFSQDLHAPSHGRPTSRRLRPTSVDIRRQRSGFTLNPQETHKSGTTNGCTSLPLPPTLSCSDRSGSLAPTRDSGLSNFNRTHEISAIDESANGPRISTDMPLGSAVSAILARRKHLEDDSDVSDSDKDSDSDWE